MKPIRDLIYRLRFALHLWKRVPDMTLAHALRYPCDVEWWRDAMVNDPIEAADEEIHSMAEDSCV